MNAKKIPMCACIIIIFLYYNMHCLHKIFFIFYKNNNNYNKIANPDDSREGTSSAISKEHSFQLSEILKLPAQYLFCNLNLFKK